MKAILEAFDKATCVKQESGHHTNVNLTRDFNAALHLLLTKEQIFKKQAGRCHSSFKKISSNPLSKFKDPSEIINWIKRRVKAEATDQGLRSKKSKILVLLLTLW